VWSFNYSGANLSAGSHTFTATATDAAGHTSPASAGFPITITNNAGPAAPSIALHLGTLLGTAVPGGTVRVFQDGALVATLPTDGSGAWSYKPTVTTDHTYHFTATATNAAGITGPASAELLTTLDALDVVLPTLAF